jgi:hypothetical protein
MSLSILRFLIFLLPILSLGVASAAEVNAFIRPNPARPNQVVSYVITVTDGNLEAMPNLRFPLQVVQTSAASTSHQINIINGRQSRSVQLSWGIMASEPGEFVIPPQDIVVDGQTLKSPELKFTVVQGGQGLPGPGVDNGPEPILQLEVGKKEVYVGEVVTLNCSLFVPRDAQLRRLGLIDIEKTDFAIARFPQQSEQSITVIDGVGYQVLTFRSTLSALRAGDLQVGPAKMELLVEVPLAEQPRQNLPGFSQFFFAVPTEPRKIIAQSPKVRLKVLPLPSEGKPAGFTGAVGDFAMDATASPTDLVVGDPLSAEITVAGSGNFDALATPSLATATGWRLYPPKRYSIEGNLDQNMPPTVERKIGFTQVLVPEAVHQELPPFELSFFSPTQKQYVTLRTNAIPLAMRPAAPPPAGADSTVGNASQPVAAPPPAGAPRPAITDIVVKPAAVATWATPAGALLWQNRTFWTIQALPWGMLVFASLFAWMRRRVEAKRHGIAGEVRQAWSSLEEGGTDDTEFLRRAAQVIHKAHAGRAVSDPKLRAILERYEKANFSGGGSAGLSPSDRQETLRTLLPLVRSAAVVMMVLLTCATLGTARAQDAKAAASPDEVYKQAVQEIEKGNFTRAQYLAESLTKRKPPQLSAEVFELIGHARYRQDDMGRAALWYQRAQLLDARSPELRQNLRHLRDKLGFITFSPSSPMVEWSYWLPANQWVLLATAGVWLILLALAWRVLAGRRATGWVAAFCVIGFLMAAPAAALAAVRVPGAERVRDVAVVVLPDVSAFTAATVTSGSVIDLPPGTQVRMLERRGAWVYVEIPNAQEPLRGWVEVPALAPLWPWEVELLP